MAGTLGCSIWSARMTGPDQDVAFVISRRLGGTFGSCAIVPRGSIILDTFFLHQRAKEFTCCTLSIILGGLCGTTFSRLIVDSSLWPVQYWRTVGVEAVVIVLVLLFVEDIDFFNILIKEMDVKDCLGGANCLEKILPRIGDDARKDSYRESLWAITLTGICPVALLTGGCVMIL